MYRLMLLVLVLMVILSGSGVLEENVVFLDVGQGDSILLQDGVHQVLVDGGPGMKVLSELGKQMPFMDRRIDVVILTHPERDHMEGLLHVLDRYEVGLVLMPRISTPTLMQEEWLERIIEMGIPYRFAQAGQGLSVGDIKLQVISPDNSDGVKVAAKAKTNNGSVVVRVDFRDMSWLLTGDVEKRVETILVRNVVAEVLDVDVLKVGHHGSNSSTYSDLLSAVSPSMAIISVGADNKFGHPRKEVLERLGDIPVWRTDERGAVKFTYLKNGWFVN